MTTNARTWWYAYGQSSGQEEPFAQPLLELLDAVETAFAGTGADTPGWDDPHEGPEGEGREALEEQYSRCLDPGKYRILWARAEAWTEVLLARGWADATEVAGEQLPWLIPPHTPRCRATVLRPRRPGAEALTLLRTATDDATGSADLTGVDAQLPGLVIALGEPALPVATIPVCGCDACDAGSADLLEDLDSSILSIVDGSFEVTLTPGVEGRCTSFGSTLSSGDDRVTVSAQLTAGPWADGWSPRPLSPPITPSPAVDLWWRRRRSGAEITCTALPESER